MECLSPIRLRNDTPKLMRQYNSEYRYVACGKCPACIDKQRKYWFVRLNEEAEHSYNSQFITLTYDEASIPLNSFGVYTFCKRDIQLFLKKLRKYLDQCQKDEIVKMHLRYFIIGEYGSKYGRPHYHGILFNIPKSVDLYKVIHKLWGKGRISVSYVTPSRIGYCSNYMYGKSDLMPDFMTDVTNKIPLLTSRKPGIGYRYVNRITIDWHHVDFKTYYQLGDIKYPLPRFWSDKLFTEEDKPILRLKQQQREKEQLEREIVETFEFYQKYGSDTPPPSVQRRREFVRNFYKRKKKHIDGHHHNHFGDVTIDDY